MERIWKKGHIHVTLRVVCGVVPCKVADRRRIYAKVLFCPEQIDLATVDADFVPLVGRGELDNNCSPREIEQ